MQQKVVFNHSTGRKSRDSWNLKLPSVDSEAWAGCVVKTDSCVEKIITQAKSNKNNEYLKV